MKSTKIRLLFLTAFLILTAVLFAGCNKEEADPVYIDFASPEGQLLTKTGNSPQIQIPSYNEIAEDALGRKLPAYEEVGAPKKNKYVGLFYSIWTSDIRSTYDNSKLLAQNPTDPQYGKYGVFHWWAEPETGYHSADEVWQIRRDMYYLSLAGVDFIYLDFTNGFIYEKAFTALADTCLEMRAEGIMTPYIVTWAFGADSTQYKDAGDLYEDFYMEEKYKDLWFYWENKPLMLIKPLEAASAAYKEGGNEFYPILKDPKFTDYFTFRVSWTSEYNYPGEEANRWRWGDNEIVNFGYSYGWDEDPSKAEFAGIGAAGFANPGEGRSGSYSEASNLNKFKEIEQSGQGITFQGSFNMVMERNPEVEVLGISRWNEWIAQYLEVHTFGFVDQYNYEFSRDIEPMKNGYTDNYYYQMCSIIRQFKGVCKADKLSAARTIDLNGGFEQWENATPVFADFAGDTMHRDSRDVSKKIKYINKTGRNDIIESRFSYNSSNVYFYVKTKDTLTSYTDENWMLLFIDSDNDKSTGWEGYDYMINKSVLNEIETVLCKYQNDLWQEIGLVSYRAEGNELHIEVPRSLLGLKAKKFSLNFHWMDNVSQLYDMSSVFTTGDSAPERRNNYAVSVKKCKYSSKGENILPARTENIITYMDALDLDAFSLKNGLNITKYTLAENYGKQPNFDLIDSGKNTYEFFSESISAAVTDTDRNFALLFEGYININEDSYYTFSLNSDDGSALYIDGRLITDNAGVHSAKEAQGRIGLCKGYHEIRIEYFETGNGNKLLECKMQKNDLDADIPMNLKRAEIN